MPKNKRVKPKAVVESDDDRMSKQEETPSSMIFGNGLWVYPAPNRDRDLGKEEGLEEDKKA